MKTIGILGGSFNPVHFGHLLMAQYAFEGMNLDQVIFMPTFVTPLKNSRELVKAQHRYGMVKSAIAGYKHFQVSDIEIKREKISYTVETLKELRKIYPNVKLYWIIGEDSLKDLHRWKEINTIGKLASFIVLNRPEVKLSLPELEVKFHQIKMTPIGLSSTEMRRRLKDRRSIDFMTPQKVMTYIKKHKLYV